MCKSLVHNATLRISCHRRRLLTYIRIQWRRSSDCCCFSQITSACVLMLFFFFIFCFSFFFTYESRGIKNLNFGQKYAREVCACVADKRNDHQGREWKEMKWKYFIRMINLWNEKYDAIASISDIGGITLTFFIFQASRFATFSLWMLHTQYEMNSWMKRKKKFKRIRMQYAYISFFFSQEYIAVSLNMK